MDWAQYFIEFMGKIPGGFAILGIIGGGVVISPFIPKILTAYKTFKAERAEEKAREEERRKKEDEERLEEIAEEREFRKRVTTIMDALPEMDKRIDTLSTTAEKIEAFNTQSCETHDHLAESISALERKMDDMDAKIENIDKNSYKGDKVLQDSIAEIRSNLKTVTGNVSMIIESDLDDFRNYLIDVHNRHVCGHEPMTKRDIELLCMKFKKYKREGGNGWAEKLYFEILQCETTAGIRAEEVARQFHYLIETTSPKETHTTTESIQ